VLEFVGIFDNLEKALAFDSKDVGGVIQGVDILQQRFAELMARARSEYLTVIAGKSGDKAVEAVLERFREKEPREAFYGFFKELQDIYEILSPDAFLRPYLPDYEELLQMFHVLRAAYERNLLVDKEFLRKTARLVQDHTESGRIEDPTKFHQLNGQALEALAEAQQPETVKVFNLLKALANLVNQRGGDEPYLISIGERAEQIAQAFEQRQMTTQQALDALQGLVRDVGEGEKQRDETGLSPEGFAIYYVLKKDGVEQPMVVAEKVEKAFEYSPHWRTSERQAQDLRRALYKALIDSGVEEDVVEVASRLMKVLRRDRS
jgi:type I restriction enzyme R subunit